jgi:hypothetical protein
MAEVQMRVAGSGDWLRKTVCEQDIPTKRAVGGVVTEVWEAVCIKPEGAKFDTVVKAFNVLETEKHAALTADELRNLKYSFYIAIPEFKGEVRTNPGVLSTHEKSTSAKLCKAIGIDPNTFRDTNQVIGKELELMVSCKVSEKNGQKYYTVKEMFEKEGVAWTE